MRAFCLLPPSPLTRHPHLLVRKIVSRLHLDRRGIELPAPSVSAVAYPDHWAPALRAWLQQVPLAPPPHPFHRVFGQDFDETMLLQLCREGPRQGERGLTADVKLIWDYSRGQPLFTNAATGTAPPDACAAFIRRWLEANADPCGPVWTCAMETAIRAVNWIFADTLFNGELGKLVSPAEWAGWLWRHGYLIWRNLEAKWTSTNHYLADLLGLFVIGSIFPEDSQARGWRRFAQGEFPRALLDQTRRDGGLYEASLRYHAYVTEMALLFRLAHGAPFPLRTEARLRDMCRNVAEFKDATGDVFPLGDDDSGRVLALDFASTTGRAEILLRLASSQLGGKYQRSASAVYPESGWWVHRAGDFAVVFEFGGVGLRGQGSHAHNDDFSFCLEWRGRPVITDPGTFLYTGDPVARNRFRATLAHNTLVVDGREQRELGRDLFVLAGSDAASSANRLGEHSWAFVRQAAPAVVHQREISVGSQAVCIRDILKGSGRHQLQWRFHLHPAVQGRLIPQGFALLVPGAGTILLEGIEGAPNLEILPSEYSALYGASQAAQVCAGGDEFILPFAAEWRVRLLEG